MANPPNAMQNSPDAEAVRAQLAEILASQVFSSSERRRKLLAYLVEETLAGRADDLKGYSIGTTVFGRGPSFDPQTDAIVRVEMHRLRRALDSFYRTHPDAPVVISIPRGGLAARFGAGSRIITDPSVGVCSFACLGAGAEGEALAASLSRRLLAALTPFEGLRVVGPLPEVAGGSEARAFATESDVQFLLRGSVREAAGRLRITVHLTDAADAEEIWSQTFEFEGATQDAFAVEDAVLEKVVGQVAGPNSVISRRLTRVRRHGDVGLVSGALQAHEAFISDPSAQTYAEARAVLESAALQEPGNGTILAVLADLYLTGWWLGLGSDEELRRQGEEFAARAARLEPFSQNAGLSLAFAHFLGRRRRLFRAEVERVSAINPHNAVTLAGLGLLVGCGGEFELGLSMIDEAIRKNPASPPWWRLASWALHYHQGEYELAFNEAERFSMPGVYLDPILRAASLGALGRTEEARPEVDRLLRMLPDLGARGRELLRRILHDDDLVDRILAGLEAAGAPVTPRIRLAHRP